MDYKNVKFYYSPAGFRNTPLGLAFRYDHSPLAGGEPKMVFRY